MAGPPGRFHTSLLHWPPAARQSVDHCRALLCHCGLVLPRTRQFESDTALPARPAVTVAGPGPACGRGPRAAGPRYQSPSKVEGLAEAAGLRAGCHSSICMQLSYVFVCICMYVYVSSIIWRKKSFSMKCHIACMLHVVCILSILTRAQWHWRDSVVGGRGGCGAGRAAAAPCSTSTRGS